MKICNVAGIQHEGETVEQMIERDRLAAAHNAAVDAEIEHWKSYPMRAMWPWCREHAPHLLPPWADQS